MKIALIGLGAVILVAYAMADDPQAHFVGNWSARSLSNPNEYIFISLMPNGRAAERVGAYAGMGHWKIEGQAAWIFWNSGWIGLLRHEKGGGWRLVTWKNGSNPKGPPDDTQPAKRLNATSEIR